MPRVSVVIPTYLRPDRVVAAAESALAQEGVDVEVIVVVDGLDDETQAVLRALEILRLVVHVPRQNLGNAAARNAGVAMAQAELVAFLDDDDLWMPQKLSRQVEAFDKAVAAGVAEPVVACRILARTGNGDLVWPRRLPREGEALSDYLYRRRSMLSGEGLVQTSMLLAHKDLMTRVPFDGALRRHVDPDWLLRAAREANITIVFPDDPAPLAIWDIADDRPRVSKTGDWRYSLRWAQARRSWFTRRAYAGFLSGPVSQSAARAPGMAKFKGFAAVAWEALRRGRPSVADVATHVANLVGSSRLRDAVGRRASRSKR